MKKKLKSTLGTALRACISIGILAFILYQADLQQISRQIAGLKPTFFTMAVFIFTLQYVLSSYKWKIILAADGIAVPFRFLIRSYTIGSFFSLFLPTSFGGDVYRVIALRGFSQDVYRSTSSVLFDRGTGLFALCSLAIVSYALVFKSIFNVALLTAYAGAVIGFGVATSDLFLNAGLIRRLSLLSPIVRILESFNRYRKRALIFSLALLIAFLFQCNIVFINKLYCLALGFPIPLVHLFCIVPLVYLTEIIPLTINGLGLRESAFVLLFNQFGHSTEEALALAVLVVIVRYSFALVIGGGLTAIAVWHHKSDSQDLSVP